MKNSIWVFFVLLLPATRVLAQTDSIKNTSSTLRYFNNFMVGVQMEFENNAADPSFAMLHGVSVHNRYAIGIGTGLDLYTYWRTLPVFASFQLNLANRNNRTFFLQVDGGYSHAWGVDNTDTVQPTRVQGGGMMSILSGLRLHSDQYVINLQVGYRFQQLGFGSDTGVIPPWRSWWGPSDYSVEQRINRVVIQVGFGRK